MVNPGVSELASLLARNPLFSELDQPELESLAGCARVKTIQAKELAFSKGTAGSQMFAIIRGRVKVSTLSREGQDVVLAILGPDEFFGEIAVLDERERTATVLAMEPSQLLVLERKALLPFLEHNPKVAIKLLTAISRRLRSTDEIVEDIVFLSVPERLAKKLLYLARDFGQRLPNGIRIALKVSQQELGDMIGTSRETVNQQIGLWRKSGLLAIDQGYITILQPAALEQLMD